MMSLAQDGLEVGFLDSNGQVEGGMNYLDWALGALLPIFSSCQPYVISWSIEQLSVFTLEFWRQRSRATEGHMV